MLKGGAMEQKRGLLDRLNDGGVVCAEGYLFEMERRGYLTAGEFVPEVALDHPEALERLHKHFMYGDDERLPKHITNYGEKA
jgi:betaine-homocysteine S-methyltransferase